MGRANSFRSCFSCSDCSGAGGGADTGAGVAITEADIPPTDKPHTHGIR